MDRRRGGRGARVQGRRVREDGYVIRGLGIMGAKIGGGRVRAKEGEDAGRGQGEEGEGPG